MFAPSATLPISESVVMLAAPPLAAEISKMPLSMTPADAATLPAPDSAKMPLAMVVVPV